MYKQATDTEIAHLKSIWNDLLNFNNEQSNLEFEKLIAKYSEAHRQYHNVGHLVEVFQYFNEYAGQLNSKLCIGLAIFFHDVIYDISSKQNEIESANYAEIILLKLNVPKEIIKRVKELIIMTQTHDVSKNDNDAMYFMDMDMAVLGSKENQYLLYCNAIKKEYSSVYFEEDYKKGRLHFLQSLRTKKQIFLNQEFALKYGKQVKQNIDLKLQILNK